MIDFSLSVSELVWLLIGLGGQALFAMRFIVQWLHSERMRQSVIPIAFWYLSLGGSIVLLTYAIHKRDPVFILGQSTGSFIYLRNLYFIRLQRRQAPPPRFGV